MMGKGARNAALLGGAAALLASKMMGGKGKSTSKSKTSFADTQDAEAGETLAGKSSGGGDTGVATESLMDYMGKSGNADKDIGPIAKSAIKSASPAAQSKTAAPITASSSTTGRDNQSYGEKYEPPMEGATASGRPREARGVLDTRTPMKRFADRQEEAGKVVRNARREQMGLKKGGTVKTSKAVSSASKRGDGIAMRGKTKGRMV
jgi:hypothetical protein